MTYKDIKGMINTSGIPFKGVLNKVADWVASTLGQNEPEEYTYLELYDLVKHNRIQPGKKYILKEYTTNIISNSSSENCLFGGEFKNKLFESFEAKYYDILLTGKSSCEFEEDVKIRYSNNNYFELGGSDDPSFNFLNTNDIIRKLDISTILKDCIYDNETNDILDYDLHLIIKNGYVTICIKDDSETCVANNIPFEYVFYNRYFYYEEGFINIQGEYNADIDDVCNTSSVNISINEGFEIPYPFNFDLSGKYVFNFNYGGRGELGEYNFRNPYNTSMLDIAKNHNIKDPNILIGNSPWGLAIIYDLRLQGDYYEGKFISDAGGISGGSNGIIRMSKSDYDRWINTTHSFMVDFNGEPTSCAIYDKSVLNQGLLINIKNEKRNIDINFDVDNIAWNIENDLYMNPNQEYDTIWHMFAAYETLPLLLKGENIKIEMPLFEDSPNHYCNIFEYTITKNVTIINSFYNTIFHIAGTLMNEIFGGEENRNIKLINSCNNNFALCPGNYTLVPILDVQTTNYCNYLISHPLTMINCFEVIDTSYDINADLEYSFDYDYLYQQLQYKINKNINIGVKFIDCYGLTLEREARISSGVFEKCHGYIYIPNDYAGSLDDGIKFSQFLTLGIISNLNGKLTLQVDFEMYDPEDSEQSIFYLKGLHSVRDNINIYLYFYLNPQLSTNNSGVTIIPYIDTTFIELEEVTDNNEFDYRLMFDSSTMKMNTQLPYIRKSNDEVFTILNNENYENDYIPSIIR